MLRKFMAMAMDPREAGRRVLDGVRHDHLHILTHAEFEQPVRERMEALLAAFPAAPPPAARAAIARRFMTDLYARERTHREESEG